MEQLSMCRICLAADLQLCPIASHLQDMYEKLTLMTFKREDRRPLVACYICQARLRNCYQLRTSCLWSDDLFTQMLNNDVVMPQVSGTNSFITMSVMHLNVGGPKDEHAEIIDVAEQKQYYIELAKKDQEKHHIQIEDLIQSTYIEDPLTKTEPDDADTDADNVHIKIEDLGVEENDRKGVSACRLSKSAHILRPKIVRQISERMSLNDTSIGTSIRQKRRLATQRRSSATTSSTHIKNEKSETDDAEPEDKPIHINNSSTLNKNRNKNHKQKSRRNRTNKIPLYRCDECNKGFYNKYKYMSHTRTHTGEKPYMCQVCSKRFTENSHLTRHIRIHTGEKPFSCEVCGKSFTQSTALTVHMRAHTGEKPYKCDLCKKCFSQQNSLKTHMLSHTVGKPILCVVCNKSFKHKRYLNIHMRTHTADKAYTCDVCKKCFNDKFYLECHVRIHTGEKPYMCDVCSKCFISKFYLVNHMRMHTGIKPHKCEICEKRFSYPSQLRVHMRKHTGVQAQDLHCNNLPENLVSSASS